MAKAVQPQFDYFEYNAAKQPESYIMENKNIKFELNPATTSFTVTQKSTGKVWYSNPPEVQKAARPISTARWTGHRNLCAGMLSPG